MCMCYSQSNISCRLSPVDAHVYPGSSLSLVQLVVALNEELKCVAYSPLYVVKDHSGFIEGQDADCLCSFTSDVVSQLDLDISTALTTIREWKNSFTYINRIPLDILSIIPTHLTSQKDCFHASFVCRHWRRAFLQHGVLWSQLSLEKGKDYVTTLLKRAKGSPLDIIANFNTPVGTITLLSPWAQQIATLKFRSNCLWELKTFSELNSGQAPPLLHTLEITSPLETHTLSNQPNVVNLPSTPFFRGSINLEQFIFHSARLKYLSFFAFPSLTTFELSTDPTEQTSILYLLDFLKASPMLQTVKVKIGTSVGLSGITPNIIVSLPNVKTFSLHMNNNHTSMNMGNQGTCVCHILTHISCPGAKHISLGHELTNDDMTPDLEIFPNHTWWNTIIHQHARSPIEKVTLKIECSGFEGTTCSLNFQSSESTILSLDFKAKDLVDLSLAEIGWEVFSQACAAIQDHPSLPHIKQLHIECGAALLDLDQVLEVAGEVEKLFCSLGPLEKLTIHGCDLRIFVAAFLDSSWSQLADPIPSSQIMFPQVKELSILHPSMKNHEQICMDAIVELAKLQHELEKPFGNLIICARILPEVEELKKWVGTVDCYKEL